MLLAGWSIAFGFSTPSLLAFGTLTDLATAAMIAALGSRVGRAGAGRGAAWLYLIWPSALFSAPLAQKESLCALLVVIIATAWVWSDLPGWKRVSVIGVAAGLLALTQPGEAPLAGLFGLVLAGRLGLVRLLRTGVPAAAIACLVLLPWWVRNWLTFGAFVPLTTSSGVGLWIGNNPGATGNWMAPPASLRGLPELEYSRQAGLIAREWITAHPVAFVRLTLAKLARSCGVADFGLVRLAAMRPAVSAWIAALLLPLSQGAHLVMLGGAAVAARLRADRALETVLLLVAACGLQIAVFGVWFEFAERHREFATPFLLLLLCLGLDRAQRGRSSPVAPRSSRASIDHRPLPTMNT
ncbi:glycosyltransferase [Sphingomonas lenta]|uniref:Glycosyltransferase n=1 Tax=Sphingomonas lenta TaxID=1141887 RepID=A0A2A2SIE4_9SPHN|nr:glycosyltransferase [Sphingomonas lenta]PAX08930.1 glycosyltransferase [Sphingomonas lenta]